MSDQTLNIPTQESVNAQLSRMLLNLKDYIDGRVNYLDPGTVIDVNLTYDRPIHSIAEAVIYKNYITAITDGDITELPGFAFSGCSVLKSVSLPAAATIAGSAFTGCSALQSVSLPAAATIGGSAFTNCKSLYSLSLGSAQHPIVNNFNLKSMSWAPDIQTSEQIALVRASLTDIISHLYDFESAGTSGTHTLTIPTAVFLYLTNEHRTEATARGWTLASA